MQSKLSINERLFDCLRVFTAHKMCSQLAGIRYIRRDLTSELVYTSYPHTLSIMQPLDHIKMAEKIWFFQNLDLASKV